MKGRGGRGYIGYRRLHAPYPHNLSSGIEKQPVSMPVLLELMGMRNTRGKGRALMKGRGGEKMGVVVRVIEPWGMGLIRGPRGKMKKLPVNAHGLVLSFTILYTRLAMKVVPDLKIHPVYHLSLWKLLPHGSASAPTIEPTKCDPGTYNPDEGAGHKYNCRLCDQGRSCPLPGLSNSSHPCAEGYYCPNGTISNDQFPCPPGTYTGQTDLSAAEECSPCWEGHYCSWGTGETVNPPQPCKPGYYCPFMTPSPDRYPCPEGTFSPAANLTKAEECTPCTPAYYCTGGEPSESGPCPPGYYCPEGTRYDEEFACPNGTYNSHYSKWNASEHCLDCTQGNYSEPGQSGCLSCEPGYYCDNDTTSYVDMINNKRCPAGLYCGGGLRSLDEATNCSLAKYCPEATPEELNCPVGTYNPSVGIGAITDCTSCDAGWYCLEGVSTPSGMCTFGYYCPTNITNTYATTPSTIGSYGQKQVPCPGGTYINTTRGRYVEDCMPCPAGYYCPLGTGTPIYCPRGYYCPANISASYPCPIGRYGNSTCSYESLPCPPGTYSNTSGAINHYDCFDCDPGYYCSNARTPQPTGPCSPGYYCTGGSRTPNQTVTEPGYFSESGSTRQSPCDLGTYMPYDRAGECFTCEEGFYCPEKAAIEMTTCPAGSYCGEGAYTHELCPPDQTIITWGDQCHEGKYCPEGTTYMVDCPKGTYLDFLGAESELDCKDCNPGKFCNETGAPLEIGDCWPGFYCTGRAERPDPFDNTTGNVCPKHYYCPLGFTSRSLYLRTYSNISGLSECWECPPGLICEPETDPYDCPEGYYCLGGADASSDPLACPRGTFGNRTGMSALSHCSDCIPGHYCETEGLAEPTGLTSAGYWSITRAIQAGPFDDTYSADFSICPEGFYCEEGSGNPDPCPPGSFSSSTHLGAIGECTPCTAGKYCPDYNMTVEAGDCDAGYYCNEGSASIRPTDGIEGDECPTGFYCPVGSPNPVACIAGRYNNETGRSSCRNCPTGYYCPQNSTVPEECPAGYYCPVRTTYAYDMYCEVPGLDWPTGPCDEGWYCINGSQFSQPSLASQGGRCPMGSYCPTGVCLLSAVLACTVTRKNCLSDRKLFCRLLLHWGASVPNPEADLTGDICPSGHYCPAGSFEGTDCPPGTYLNTTGNKDLDDCINCTQGYYCEGYANIYPDDNCAVGYYCPPGQSQTSPFIYKCPQGHYCEMGSFEPTRCDSGYYQDEEGQGSCKDCPQGYFCDNTKAPVVLYNNAICPEGHYCPPRTRYDTEFPCPRGTYSNRTGLNETSQCDPCCGGYFCPNEGMTECLDLCYAGYYCKRNAEDGTPSQDPDADLCPMGYYCPNGTADPLGCPPGTYSDQFGLETVDDCSDCTPGYYCDNYAQTQPTAECHEGYYCPDGSDRSNQLDCPAGYYCLNGTFDPTPCPRGTYSNDTNKAAASECYPCSGGFYCETEGLTIPTGECAEGYYCPDGTIYREPNNTFCPVGHYCPGANSYPIPCQNNTYVNYTHAVMCLDCPAGYFCKFQGEQEICPMGYVCPAGTGYYCPANSSSYEEQPCPSGHYCPEGTEFGEQFKCSPGTFNNLTISNNLTDCVSCLAGYYCASNGLPWPSGLCEGGYYCDGGSTTATPSGSGGDRCLAGTFCPPGSPYPTPCDGGSYCAADLMTNTSGLCDPGYYCHLRATVPNPNDGNVTGDECPLGAYCPEGSASPLLCDAGYFLNSTHNDEESDCLPCTAGYYCAGSGNPEPTDVCQAGYYCPPGQREPTPAEYNCTLGHYCPTGSTEPVRCDSGYYQDETGQFACKDCPEGYFCDNTFEPVVLYNSSMCPTGFYCPMNTYYATEFPCPRGTFNNLTHRTDLSDCQPCAPGDYCDQIGLSEPAGPCDAGFFCLTGSNSSSPTFGDDADECPVGHYCPQGTAQPQACPPGTYSPSVRRQAVEECLNCTAGRYCPTFGMNATGDLCSAGYYCESGADIAEFVPCPQGHYCPMGTDVPEECPPGTWSDQTQLTAENECYNCTAGFYCPTSAMTVVTEICWGGYYCPPGQSSPNPSDYLCPIGVHCPNGSEIYQSCPSGSYANYSGAAECDTCPEGYYCTPVTPENATLGYQACPMGTGLDWQPCPAGTYSPSEGLRKSLECLSCDPGLYCQGTHLTAPTGNCSAGYYCTSGVDQAQPGVDNTTINCTCPEQTVFTGEGGICPVAHYCPEGSSLPLPCDAGTYNDEIAQETCKVCPAGYYCMMNSSEYSSFECPSGHYCPNGTTDAYEFPCPPGTYNSHQRSDAVEACLSCPKGTYCAGYGNSNYTDLCDAGWYCSGGASSSNTTSHGGQCQSGFYCPRGSGEPLACPGGEFCQTSGLPLPTGLCSSGYYCSLASTTPTPTDGVEGDICPAGFYCEEGTQVPSPCPPGTYSFTTMNVNVSDCLACDLGQYCGAYNLTEPSGNCSQGYYCPLGQLRLDAIICPVGYYCPEGTFEPFICPSGTYQLNPGEWTCDTCPAGYYCDSTGGVVNVTEDVICPQGYFCPMGTKRADEFPCPRGTFGNSSGLEQEGDCTPCAGGYYCEAVGQTEPTDLCDAGFYCRQYANVTTPRLGYDADICPQGYYCPEGTAEPFGCPPGTFGGTEGLHNTSSCTPCLAGYYCEGYGLDSVQGECSDRYYCPEGSSSRTEVICTTGNYCPQGSDVPTACPEGTFNPYLGLNDTSQCTPCTPGSYCETQGLSAPTDICDEGYYCPEGQNSSRPEDYPCPVAHYCPLNSSEPLPCQNGTYMNHTHAAVCDICPAGWYCLEGLITDSCPEGYYCPDGTGIDWQPCPRGTFNNETGLQEESQCKDCLGGYYCDQLHMTDVNGPCDPGYYCEYRVDRAKPSGDFNATCQLPGDQTGPGDVCPEGHYCPTGSDQPILCPAGSYANQTGLETCLQCPEGYYCTEGSVIYHDKPCPEGHFCPAGTQSEFENPCPAGTFYNTTMASDVNDCLPCTCGFYCELDGLPEPTGYCAPGWYCNGSSTSNTTTTDGGICQEGTYCPEGSCLPTLCDPGTYCQTDGLDSPTGNCSAGYYCVLGASSPAPNDTTGAVCPVGHYCPEGSEAQMPCPTGYFLNSVGNDALEDCLDCTPGWYCPGEGRELPLALCDAGYYCPLGQNVSSPPSYRCPVGHFCEEGSFAPTRCENGTYQDVEGRSSCKECPQGYFCDNTVEPVVLNNDTTRCPSGHYCPPGTRYDTEYPCPIGTFNNLTGDDANICPPGYFCPEGTDNSRPCPKGTFSDGLGLEKESDCQLCTPGDYCGEVGMTNTSGPCDQGYYCELGSWDPRNSTCPSGHYCEEGSGSPEPCPQGTYSGATQRWNVTQCVDCDEGWFCNETGLSSPVDECDGGFYCPPGQSVPNPGEYPCPIGLHCPIGSPLPVPCDPGSFTNLTHAAECLECPAGFYCVPEHVEEGNSTSGFRLCPQGYYCPAGTGRNWTACPPGTYGGRLGLETDTDCTDCPGGWYCDGIYLVAPSDECDPGYFCTSRVDRSNPTPFENDTCTYDGPTLAMEESVPSATTALKGQSCLSAVMLGRTKMKKDGHIVRPVQLDTIVWQMQQLTSSYTLPLNCRDTICPEGYYCPSGTEYDIQEPCPEGTFNNLTGAHNISWCTPCLPGWYCQGQGNGYPTDLCDPGWYCTNSSITPQPSDPYQGGECQAGASQPVECDSGSYCDVAGLDQPFDLCKPGYYCGRGSTTGTPSGVAGDRCSPGHYCIEGSEYETMCPPGTYQPSYWAKNITYCLDCLAGKYCNDSGLSQPEGKCDPGFYCPGGQTVSNPNEYRCQEGYYCPLGSPGETPCPAGWYQDQDGQPDCKECLPGFYCDDTNGPVVNYTLYICPEGHYCPNGTQAATQYECPIGTFNNITGLTEEEECSPCLAGYYCGQRGLTYPYTYCSGGYYCRTGARLATPDQGDDANICPVGHYCLEGCTEPVTCPAGTFSNDTGLMNVTECEPCDAGYYCGSDGLTEPTDQCEEGFYCERGSDDPQQYVCPAGKYCPLGTSVPHKCPAATTATQLMLLSATLIWNPATQIVLPATTVLKVRDWTSCTVLTGRIAMRLTCTRSHSAKIVLVVTTVPIRLRLTTPSSARKGTGVSQGLDRGNPNAPGLQRHLHNETCPLLGGYTGVVGCAPEVIVVPKVPLYLWVAMQGFYCVANSTDYAYSDCPAGYYCPLGPPTPLSPCPRELSIMPQDPRITVPAWLASVACTAKGRALPERRILSWRTEATIPCEPGWYCHRAGLAEPRSCVRAGYYCTGGTSVSNPTDGTTGDICPMGHYCPEGSDAPLPCDMGYYLDATEESAETACKICTKGFYCNASGLAFVSGDCQQGYYCPEGQVTPTPSNHTCPEGHYCETGSGDPVPCPSGTFQDTPGQWTCKTCMEGHYCNATIGPVVWYGSYVCPSGYYCPNGTTYAEEHPCPLGTFNNITGLKEMSQCTDCIGGMACDENGLSFPKRPCAAGYYCRIGADTTTPHDAPWNGECPAGYYCMEETDSPSACPEGTISPNLRLQSVDECLNCTAGYYCNETALTEVAGPCYASFYCPEGSTRPNQIVCPEGYYCPEATADPFSCPNGTFSNGTALQDVNDCFLCTPGYYCDGLALTEPTAVCEPGYYCPLGSSHGKAVICPVGRYCPQGSASPQECPAGTYMDHEGEAACEVCPEGYYCVPENVVVGVAFTTYDPCPMGFFCPNGTGHDWQSCPAGTYGAAQGLTAAEECTPCDGGQYCGGVNLTEPTDTCMAGFYCISGADKANPFMIDLDQCPTNTVHPIIGHVCPEGHYCPEGTVYPQGCPAGSYNDEEGRYNCKSCPESYYCYANTTDYQTNDCPSGYYCPTNTTDPYQYPCPSGTFNNATLQKDVGDCLECTPGYYCAGEGNSAPTDVCDEGWYCSGVPMSLWLVLLSTIDVTLSFIKITSRLTSSTRMT
ncbi:hypothetical protein BSL78_21986 [Apostichopus japonicus]|uniref:Uncharacterized protein n=1 Tax=Stichopus japonicus TaxID=307972 RepID=A0A2G8JZJ3_STIJA|nr:hypothetical protein BSL78_21986 [Apostichopus japonicus]